MNDRNFRQLLEGRWRRKKYVCVGLDSNLSKIPSAVHKNGDVAATIFAFNKEIVDATKDIAGAYKPQLAFYSAHGPAGWNALYDTVHYILEKAPDVPVILDAKLNDIGDVSELYASSVFDWLGADAVTVNPYMGQDSLKPFLERKEKGIIVLCLTSNEYFQEFEGLHVAVPYEEVAYLQSVEASPWSQNPGMTTLCNHVAYQVSTHWNKNNNCALVTGAPFPVELQSIRRIVGDMPLLIPGVGFQMKGMSLEEQVSQVVAVARNSEGVGMIINSSRGIIFASDGPDFAEAARREALKLNDAIVSCIWEEVNV